MVAADDAAATLDPIDVEPVGILPPTHIRKISTTPMVNGKLR